MSGSRVSEGLLEVLRRIDLASGAGRFVGFNPRRAEAGVSRSLNLETPSISWDNKAAPTRPRRGRRENN